MKRGNIVIVDANTLTLRHVDCGEVSVEADDAYFADLIETLAECTESDDVPEIILDRMQMFGKISDCTECGSQHARAGFYCDDCAPLR